MIFNHKPCVFWTQFMQVIDFKHMLIVSIIVGCHQTSSKNGRVLVTLRI